MMVAKKLKEIVIVSCLCIFPSVGSDRSATLETDPNEKPSAPVMCVEDFDQKKIREKLLERLPHISEDKKKSLENNISYFLLPIDISNALEGKNVLEVGYSAGASGWSAGASVRALGNASKVSLVDPDSDALAMGLFDKKWTCRMDSFMRNSIFNNTAGSGEREPFVDYAKRMNLTIDWVEKITEEDQWIPDSVSLYPVTLQELPLELNGLFDFIAYKDYNVPQKETESFFNRLQHLIKPDDGAILIQPWTREYEERDMDEIVRKYFEEVHLIYDELGHEEVISENPLTLKNVPNDIRMVILRKPKV